VAGEHGERLQYNGGPVQHEPQLYLLFWGSAWESHQNLASELAGLFYGNLKAENEIPGGTAAWQGILSQYYSNTKGPYHNAKIISEAHVNNIRAPQNVEDATVQQEAAEFIRELYKKGTPPNANAQFIVLPAPGSTYKDETLTKEGKLTACGYHGVVAEVFGTNEERYSYTLVPYGGDVEGLNAKGEKVKCNYAGSYGGSEEEQLEHSTTFVASHEFAESVTDPLTSRKYNSSSEDPYPKPGDPNVQELYGWTGQPENDQTEIADECVELGPFQLPKRAWVSKLWDDEGGDKCSLEDPPYASPSAPTVTSTAATSVKTREATLNGKVNPNGPDAHYHFEYGTTTAYGSSTPEGDAGFGTSAVPESAKVVLYPSTTYHYRIVASNWAGTSYGADKEFTTSAASTVLGWGKNSLGVFSEVGQLGNGTKMGPEACRLGYECSEFPVAVSGSLSEVASVSSGSGHSLAVLSTGTVMAWGSNGSGELGNGTTTSSNVPVKVSSITTATSASAGEGFSLALLKNDTVEAWGSGTEGQLGNGTTTSSSTPVAVSGITEAIAMAAGKNHGLALLKNGTVMAWGANTDGQLGNGTTTSSNVPVKVSNITEAVAVSAGYSYSLAVLKNGTVMAWGANEAGQLGDGTTTNSDVPVAVSSLSEVGSVAAGEEYALALLKNGTIMSWGINRAGVLGDGTCCEKSDVPVKVSNTTEATAIAAGGYRGPSLALLKNGTVQDWGGNDDGELGIGPPGVELCEGLPCSMTPVTVSGLSGVTSIASGSGRAFAFGSTPSFTQAIDSGHNLNAVSCVPRSTDCVASDSLGNAYYATNVSASGTATWNTWKGPGPNPSWAVNCPTTTMCLLADGTDEVNGGNLYYATSLGGAWTLALSPAYGVDAISCASETFCVSGQDNLGYFYYSTSPPSTSWTREEQGSAKMNSVSCLSTTFCAIVDSAGDIHVATTKKQVQSSSWTVTNVDGTKALNAVACTSTTSCVAVDGAGNVLNLTINAEGNATVEKQNVDGTNSLTAITCTTVATCVAVDDAGGVFVSTSEGASWTKQYEYAPSDNLTSVSCSSASLCTTTNTAGNTTTIDPR
jgi:alpha-tubulin suppressor-like RCC1 family protein